MWKADGNCLIFFAEETNDEDPKPVCRIHSQTLESARSVFMSEFLPQVDSAFIECEQIFTEHPALFVEFLRRGDGGQNAL